MHPQKQEEPPHQSEPCPPAIPKSNKEETEADQDQDKSQLSSSVIIEVPNVQSGLELSTITGTTVGLYFSGDDTVTFFFKM